MPWAAERKVSPQCSHEATASVDGRHLCTFHANRANGTKPLPRPDTLESNPLPETEQL